MVELRIDRTLKWGSTSSQQGVGGTEAIPGREISESKGWWHPTDWGCWDGVGLGVGCGEKAWPGRGHGVAEGENKGLKGSAGV